MKKITIDWFVGFVEGEGSFSYSKDGGGNLIPSFTLSQNNKEIIQRVHNFLQFGKIYFNK